MGEKSINEVNDSMKVSKRNFNDINDKSMKKKVAPGVGKTEYIADQLVKIFNAPKSRKFFLKCAWNLSEDTIWSAVEDARKRCVNTPIALFIFLCNEELQRAPIKK